MSPESKDVTDSLAEELTSFDDKLKATANDVDMLTGIRQGINRLLEASGNNEAAIRQVLQHQYDSGALRKETFQRVKSMLDSYSTENMPTSPDAETIAVQQGMAPAAPSTSQKRTTTTKPSRRRKSFFLFLTGKNNKKPRLNKNK